MVKEAFIPQRGDIVWLQFSPQARREQAGHRPALCLSPQEYNKKVGLGLFCPLTSNQKGYPFEVSLPPPGYLLPVLSWQIT
jgi:mRNA interferase MazF